jgi:predicted nucleotidyltransferase
MMNIRKKFDTALFDTVEEWKKKDQVRGIFVYGSYARGTMTANSDLDICIVWDKEEAPAKLLAEHKGILIDMTSLSPRAIEDVLSKKTTNCLRVAEVVCRFKNARVVHDTGGMLKKLQDRVAEYKWPEDVVKGLKAQAVESLTNALRLSEQEEDSMSATYELRNGLFDLGRVLLMKNSIFCIIKPSEVLNEVRMFDPMTYGLFLRTFKLKGLEEEDLRGILGDVKHWIEIAEERLKNTEGDTAAGLLAQAQREYYGAMNLTVGGDYELAVFEMRQSVQTLGLALLAIDGLIDVDSGMVVKELQERESEFYDQVFIEYGSIDFQPKEIRRSIGEAQFVAQRL